MSPFLLESWRSFLLSICQFSPVNVLYFLLYIFLRVNLTFVEKNYLSFLDIYAICFRMGKVSL